ncbi:MAG: flavodoxin family protein [Oscillospiraceae bacterium]
MKVLILQGSPRKNGNTKQLADVFADEMRANGADVQEEWIYDKNIKPCMGCKHCQDVIGELGCVHKDDFAQLVDEILAADLTVFATPIYAYYPPGPVKTFIDRLMYAPVKEYGEIKAPSLLQGKSCAIIMTSGFDPAFMVASFELTLSGLSKKHGMHYFGWCGGTDPGKGRVFMNEKKEARLRQFAHELIHKMAELQ